MDNPLRHPPGVPRVEKPRAEGQFLLADGRRLGYAEFGDPTGPVVLWFHGTLGARRQFLAKGRRAAETGSACVSSSSSDRAPGCPILTATPR